MFDWSLHVIVAILVSAEAERRGGAVKAILYLCSTMMLARVIVEGVAAYLGVRHG